MRGIQMIILIVDMGRMGLKIACQNNMHQIILSQNKVVIKVLHRMKQIKKQTAWSNKEILGLNISKPKIEAMKFRNAHSK